MFIMKFGLVVQLVYTLRFVKRIRKYVLGQCPGKKVSSIGKYRRNVVNLGCEFWCSVLGSCFPGLDYAVRKISMNQTPEFVFLVNFVLLDGAFYLFFVTLFFALSRDYIPSKELIPDKCFFYVSWPKHLEPRRSSHIVSSLALQENTPPINVSFPVIPLVRRIVLTSKGRQYKIINYVSTRKADLLLKRRNGPWLETKKERGTCPLIIQVQPACSVDENLDFDSSQDDLRSQPSSSTKSIQIKGRFCYWMYS